MAPSVKTQEPVSTGQRGARGKQFAAQSGRPERHPRSGTVRRCALSMPASGANEWQQWLTGSNVTSFWSVCLMLQSFNEIFRVLSS